MEIFDELDERGRFTGKTVTRAEAHESGAWHRGVLIFVLDNANRVLMQKRSMSKELWPGRWDGTAAGHVDAGEIGLFSAIRELEEELGFKVHPSDVRYIGGYLSEDKIGKIFNRHVNEFYVAHLEVDTSKLELQSDEVTEIAWVDFNKFKSWTRQRAPELTEKWAAFDALIRYVEGYCK